MLKSLAIKLLSIPTLLFSNFVLFSNQVFAQTDPKFIGDTQIDPDTLRAGSESLNEEAVAAILIVYFIVIAVITIALYIYMGVVLSKLAKQLNFPKPWWAWVPLLNLYLMVKLADLPGWTVILMLIPFVSIFFPVYLFAKIGEKRGFHPWLGAAVILPVVGIFVPAYLAYATPPSAQNSAV